jgi:hypothetical protein
MPPFLSKARHDPLLGVLGGLSVCLLVDFGATHDGGVSRLSFLHICGGMWALVDLGSAGASARG